MPLVDNIYDVAVVGAGFSGCNLALNVLNEDDFNICLIEMKDVENEANVGKLCCSGLVSKRFMELYKGKVKRKIKGLVENEIKGCKFFPFSFPKNSLFLSHSSTGSIKSPEAYVFNRKELDKLFFFEVRDKVDLFSNFCFVDGRKTNSGLVKIKLRKVFENEEVFLKAKALAGCDGVNSKVREVFSLSKGLLKIIDAGIVRFRFDGLKGMENNGIVHFIKWDKAKGFFAWRIPINEESLELGLGVERKAFNETNAGKVKTLLKELSNFYGLDFGKGEVCFHPICYGELERTALGNVLLIGDAALQVKPFSGGGIIYSAISSKIASQVLVSFLRSELNDLSIYDDLWKKELLWPIREGLMFRRVFDFLSEEDFCEVLKSLRREEDFCEVANHLDMDFL